MITHKILSELKQFDCCDRDFLDSILKSDCFSVVDHKDDLDCLCEARLISWLEKSDEFIILGTGGSNLGAQCIYEISNTCCADSKKRIHFISNLDTDGIAKILSEVKDLDHCGILCISKSGETLETITLLLFIMQKFGRMEDISSKVVVITEDKSSTLRQIAIEKNFVCLNHPKTIGGRFSVFSIVGMLPAVMCGMSPKKIRAGGSTVLHGDLQSVKDGISFVVQNINHKMTTHVSFIYSDKLIYFGHWLAQLYAESSGKNGLGVTPITARGSVDQHSQLQLYLDGTSDKCFSFFFEDQDRDFSIESAPQNFSYISRKKISEIFNAQCNATIASIFEKNIPVRKFTLPKITPEIVGQLFMHFMIEVSCVCKIIGVNPYDQPAVERGKILTKKILSEM